MTIFRMTLEFRLMKDVYTFWINDYTKASYKQYFKNFLSNLVNFPLNFADWFLRIVKLRNSIPKFRPEKRSIGYELTTDFEA